MKSKKNDSQYKLLKTVKHPDYPNWIGFVWLNEKTGHSHTVWNISSSGSPITFAA